ncbi:hypothetical protein REMIM1_PE00550 (plasmid) [Rhizobium etli bv. mimosae str. Mim1]|nr:hypothetical protein REMIM1_PE00550 [Rhizobium etli bv. mimosae str. Mim1]
MRQSQTGPLKTLRRAVNLRSAGVSIQKRRDNALTGGQTRATGRASADHFT